MSHPFRVLIDNDRLLRRIHELARCIAADHRDEPPALVAVIEGARVFARHLQKLLPGDLPVEEIRAASYFDGQESNGDVKLVGGGAIRARDRGLLLIEDIVDTGRTVTRVREHFLAEGARSVRVVTLLSKPARRVVPVDLDYVGFEIPDEFVVGFGMDFAGRYRELPDVVIYEESRARA